MQRAWNWWDKKVLYWSAAFLVVGLGVINNKGGTMFRRILVSVDGSPTAGQALQQAIKLAKEMGAQLRIVHVVNEVTFNWPEGGQMSEVMGAFQEAGRKVLASAEAEARKAGISVETRMAEIETVGHHVADTIASEAQAWPADLIVIGTHGRRGINRLLLGSVAEGVARVATKPVLLIRGQ
jgi:nucleotide-binding universal stress UspA family protein